MNRQSLFGKSLFKFAHRTWRSRVGGDRKKWRRRNQTRDLAKILGFIRRDSHRAIRNQRPMERGEEGFGHETARRMPAFWPGIGKHDVEPRDGIFRKQALDGIGNLEAQESRVR